MCSQTDVISELCAYVPCKCRVSDGEMFCSEICAMLGAKLVTRVTVSSSLPLKPDAQVVPRCACGHDGCGDNLVSGDLH